MRIGTLAHVAFFFLVRGHPEGRCLAADIAVESAYGSSRGQRLV